MPFDVAPGPGLAVLPGGATLNPSTGNQKVWLAADIQGNVNQIGDTLKVSVTLTPAQIKAFDNTTPTSVIAVPAPAANQLIEVIGWNVDLQFVAPVYSAGGTGVLVLGNDSGGVVTSIWSNTRGLLANAEVKANASQFNSSTGYVLFNTGGGALPITTFTGKALLINQSAGTLFAAGNSPVVVNIYYRIVTVS